MQVTITPNYEQILINIARELPSKRAEQLIDFARFLEAQSLSEKLTQGEAMAEIEADNAQWDALLATDESQDLLEKMAAEALAEHQAGRTRPMTFDKKGEIAPG
jgi:CRISPR/Cas system-associated protein Csm6